MSRPLVDWAEVVDRLVDGDRLAVVQLSRLIRGFLTSFGAHGSHELREEWDDLVQEVLAAIVVGRRKGHPESRAATYSWIKRVTFNKLVDRVKRSISERQAEEPRRDDDDLGPMGEIPDSSVPADALADLRKALEQLPEKQRAAVLAVYGEGKTYQEAADAMGIPLGTFKGYLADGLAELRKRYDISKRRK